jgi:CPA2 family monovalent cation:H+ antiporter-2
VGINLELGAMFANLWLLLGAMVLFSAIKILGNFVAFRVSGSEYSLSVLLSFLLAQGSEFAFVLIGLASTTALINPEVTTLCISMIGLSLAVTPMISGLGCYFARSVCSVNHEDDALADDPREVIIVRIDEFGRQLAGLLDGERIPYRAHDQDLERLAYAKTRGLNAYYSDLNRPRTLGRVSLGKALAVVSLIEDDMVLRPLIEGLRKVDQSVPFLAASESPIRLELLQHMGVENAFVKNERSMIALFESLMRTLQFEESRIEDAVERALQLLEPDELFPQVGGTESFQVQSAAA